MSQVVRLLLATTALPCVVVTPGVAITQTQSPPPPSPAQSASPAPTAAPADAAPTPPPPGDVATSGPAAAAGSSADIAANPASTGEQIVVTGSVFRRANTETPSPVTVLSADMLQQRGISTVTTAIQTLSANGSGNLTNAFSANGAFAAGASAPSLRGLTTDSTLVLFDGLRASYYPLADDGARNFVDTNTVPEAIVDRIEVLKDGASATYGADAVAGVVNIKLKKQITGFHGLIEGGISQRSDAPEQHISATYGYGDLSENGFNVYANFEFQHDGLLRNNERGFPYNTGDLRAITGVDANGNVVHDLNSNQNGLTSSGQYQGLGNTIVPYARPVNPDGTLGAGQVIDLTRGCQSLVPHNVGTVASAGNLGTICEQNIIGDYRVIQPRQQRLGGTLHATVNVGDRAQAYAVFTYYQNDTLSPGTPQSIRQTSYTGNFTTTQLNLPALLPNGQLNPNNPFAAQGLPARIYYRFGDIPISTQQLSKTYRGAIGISGEFGDDWGYSFDATGMNSVLSNTFTGYIYGQGLLDAVNNGTYNFVNPELNSDAVRQSIAPTVVQHARSQLYQAQGLLSKKLFHLPGGDLQLAVGGAVRYEAVNDPSANPNAISPDFPNPAQQYPGINPFFSSGHRWVESGYFEINAPIVKPLELDISGRYDHYSTGFSNFSPKVGAKYEIMKQVAVRGTFSKGFRVPSFAETNSTTIGFTTQGTPTSFQLQHPLDPTNPAAGPNAYASAYSLGANTTGNPDLKPEKSTNFTGGIILQPKSWLSVTADYYHIKKTRVITPANYTDAVNAYYAGQPIPAGFGIVQDVPDPDYPNAQRRILVVSAPYINASSLKTDGIDVQANVNLRLSDNVRFFSTGEATYVIRLDQRFPGQATQHYAGTLGPYNTTSASGTPRWRAQWQNTLTVGRYSLTATAYYTSGYKESAEDVSGPGTANDCFGNAAVYNVPRTYEDQTTPIRCGVKSFVDVDLHGAVKINDKFTFYADMLNAFDAKATFDPTTYGGYQYNSSWSQAGIIGRYFKVGANFAF